MKGILLTLIAAAVFWGGYVLMGRLDAFLDAYARSEAERDEHNETEAEDTEHSGLTHELRA